MGKSKVVFDAKEFGFKLYESAVKEQTNRLIEYAKEKILEIGNDINSWHSANHMDRTGNLLNSLCWGVSYKGKLVGSGFYRDPIVRGKSYMHEWFSREYGDISEFEEVNGRELAQTYLDTYSREGMQGWQIFFAILAPYWGYWEKGFKMKSHFGDGQNAITATYQFAVMTHHLPKIRADLRPARVRPRISVRHYSVERLERRWKKYAGFD